MKLYYATPDCERILVLAAHPRGQRSAAAKLAVAWAWRQRDPPRSERSLDELDRMLARTPGATTDVMKARSILIRAELAWLRADVDQASRLLEQNRVLLNGTSDFAGMADAALCQSRLANDTGDIPRREQAMASARRYSEAIGDTQRSAAVQAWAAVDASFRGEEIIGDRAADPGGPAVLGLWLFAQAQAAFARGAYGDAAATFRLSSLSLAEAGLVRQCMSASINRASSLGNLNDFDGQAEVLAEVQTLADHCGWPLISAACYYALGDVHHALGRLDDAKTAFEHAQQHIKLLPTSRVYVAVHSYLGEIRTRLGDYPGANDALTAALEAAERGGHLALISRILAALAACESAAGRHRHALRLAHQALERSEGKDLVTERLALLALARIHIAHPGVEDPNEIGAAPALGYLRKLWARLEECRDWEPDDELLALFSAAHERSGDVGQALLYERRRVEALSAANIRRANEQTSAMQARHETRLATQALEYQRQLGHAERQRLQTVERLAMVGRDITTSLALPDVLELIGTHARDMLEADTLGLWLLQDHHLTPAHLVKDGRPVTGRLIPLDDGTSSCARAARERCEILVDSDEGGFDSSDAENRSDCRTALYAALESAGRVLGVFCVASTKPNAYGESERHVFRNLVSYCAVAVNNALSFRALQLANEKMAAVQAELEVAARHDMLTGLSNRRHLMQSSNDELTKARNGLLATSVLLLDIDHFKAVNDHYGHAAGDEALKMVGSVLRNCVRPGDVVGRYGGEEFAVVLPSTDLHSAQVIAERVREHLARTQVEHSGRCFCLTVSIGVAMVHPDDAMVDLALNRADQALYVAKREGRNRVHAFRSDGRVDWRRRDRAVSLSESGDPAAAQQAIE